MDEERLNSPEGENEEKKNKKGVVILLFIIGIILVIFGAVQIGTYFYSQYRAQQEKEHISSIVNTTRKADEGNKNPIDFESLQKGNDEIYAWIKIPETPIDYPIVQSGVDDKFYLTHSAFDKSYLSPGAIFTESCNSKDFTDRVTLVYGHNGYTDIMFMPLHEFEKKEYFDSHEIFYIYTPHSRLTYTIVSAFKYDNRHIMNSFNFQNNATYAEFLEMIQNPTSTVKNVRKDLDKELTIEDNIVVLSTCVWHQDANRYLVCGVLTDNEKTD